MAHLGKNKRNIHEPRDKHLVTCRYEDDLLVISFTICPCCVTKLVQETYDSGVTFDRNEDHESQQEDTAYNKFLDIILAVKFKDPKQKPHLPQQNTVHIDLFCTNKDYIHDADVPHPTRYQFPPPLGRQHTIISRLSANLLSRRARWDQLALSSDDIIRSAVVDFVELYRYGYSTNVIWRAWYQRRGHDAGLGLGLRVLQKSPATRLQKRQKIWPMPQQTLDFLQKMMGVDTSSYPYDGIHDKPDMVEIT